MTTASSSQPAAASSRVAPSTGDVQPPARILVADDDRTLRALARATLERDGHQIDDVADGIEAVRRFTDRPYDLVIMDIDMPTMTGLDACARIRRASGGLDVPVLMVTSLEDPGAIGSAYGAGATDFQPKPLNWTVLAHRVRYLLRARWASARLRQSEAQNRALLSAIPDAMFQIDVDGVVMDFKQGTSQTQLPLPDVVVGRSMSDIMPTDIANLCQHFVRKTVHSSQLQLFEYQWNVGGETRHFEARTVVGGPDNAVAIIRDITERKRSDAEVQFHTYHDGVTKLPNRLLIRDHLVRGVAQAREQDEMLAVIFVGLDCFTQINDTFGYSLGDVVLRHVAAQLTRALRGENRILQLRRRDATTLVGRFTGDEFTVVVPALAGLDVVNTIVEQLRQFVAEPFELDGREVFLTACTGVSIYPSHGTDADTLLKNADTALKDAKRAGRGSHRSYHSTMNANAARVLTLEAQLRRALERDEFRTFLQPKVDTSQGVVRGAEALLRWAHPVRGVLAPGEFLKHAEEMGLLIVVGDRQLSQVCQLVRRWQDRDKPVVPVAVNLSDQEFRREGLVKRVHHHIDAHGIDPRFLELEITERVLIRDEAAARELVAELRALGIRISIDDFGTGQSSLSMLKELPVDTLKIDRSFIRDLETDSGNASLTSTIIRMGHDLGMTVVAEGVETAKQREILAEMGCDQIQGFLISPAVDREVFGAMLDPSLSGISFESSTAR